MLCCVRLPDAHVDRPPVGLAWYSMLGSYRLLRQMAQVSVQMAQDHMATAFHFLISKRLPDLGPFVLPLSAAGFGSAVSTSMASTSAMAPARVRDGTVTIC